MALGLKSALLTTIDDDDEDAFELLLWRGGMLKKLPVLVVPGVAVVMSVWPSVVLLLPDVLRCFLLVELAHDWPH